MLAFENCFAGLQGRCPYWQLERKIVSVHVCAADKRGLIIDCPIAVSPCLRPFQDTSKLILRAPQEELETKEITVKNKQEEAF